MTHQRLGIDHQDGINPLIGYVRKNSGIGPQHHQVVRVASLNRQAPELKIFG